MIKLDLSIDDILKQAVNSNASDVHITVGRPPVFRIRGELEPQQEFPMMLPDNTAALVHQMLSGERLKRFEEEGEVDFAYSVAGAGRFRVNAYHQRGSAALALRLINSIIPSMEVLNLPKVVTDFTTKPKGMVLVTGPTGSGKSTTLAAMIDIINRERSCHIITLEDPIEYLHRHNKSIVNQREIGSDSHSFSAALRAAMREDPDVILVGEMRDLETIATAITAAETGHLVFATLHTASAAQTVDRIIDVFPPHQQQQVRVQLAETLQGVIAQQLLARVDKPGRVAVVEVMVTTPAIRNLIREGKTHQLISAIQTGGRYGMQTLDNALKVLYQQKIISKDDVMLRVTDASSFMGLL